VKYFQVFACYLLSWKLVSKSSIWDSLFLIWDKFYGE
jgi:hypothetical protein